MKISLDQIREIQEFYSTYGRISRTWLMKKYKLTNEKAVKVLDYLNMGKPKENNEL